MAHFTSNPIEDDCALWFVWDMEQALPPLLVFIGEMEECGLVADALNAREAARAQEG